MDVTEEQIVAALMGALSKSEHDGGVLYIAEPRFDSASTVDLGGSSLSVSANSQLAFVDREPLANWGHACRYLVLKLEDLTVASYESRFPPPRTLGLRWRVVYKAQTVPDTVPSSFIRSTSL